MTSYQEPEKKNSAQTPIDDLSTYQALVEQLAQELSESKRHLEQAESVFDTADEEAFNATAAADEGEKAYQAHHDQLATLRAEEESMRTATELANALAADATNLKTDGHTNYSDLLSQAMTALITVSSNAEQELKDKQNQLSQAEQMDLTLHLEAAASKLAAHVANVRRLQAGYDRLHSQNTYNINELQYKLAQTRNELADKLSSIRENRASLDRMIGRYHQVVEEAQSLTAEEEQHKSELSQLKERLSATVSEIIPYETMVNDLDHEESDLADALVRADRAADLAEQQRGNAAALLDQATQTEQENQQELTQQLYQLMNENRSQIKTTEDQLQALSDSLGNAKSLADHAKDALESHLAEMPVLESENAKLLEALEKAKRTAGETARMVANVQAAKTAMKDKSTGLLSGAESVLHNTLQTANDMVVEKEQLYDESCRLVKEKRSAEDFLKQAAERATASLTAVEDTFAATKAQLQKIQEEARRSETDLRTSIDQKLNEVRIRRLRAAESLTAAEKVNEAKQQAKEETEAHLQDVRRRHQEAVQARDRMRQQIQEINGRIEEENMRESADRENQIIALWEESEELHLSIRETGVRVKRSTGTVHSLTQQQARLANNLQRTIDQANQAMKELVEQNVQSIGNQDALVSNLEAAMADYEAGPEDAAPMDKAPLRSAASLLEAYNTVRSTGLPQPAIYESSLGPAIEVDKEMLSQPIPQIDEDEDLDLLLTAEEAAVDSVPKQAEDEILAESNSLFSNSPMQNVKELLEPFQQPAKLPPTPAEEAEEEAETTPAEAPLEEEPAPAAEEDPAEAPEDIPSQEISIEEKEEQPEAEEPTPAPSPEAVLAAEAVEEESPLERQLRMLARIAADEVEPEVQPLGMTQGSLFTETEAEETAPTAPTDEAQEAAAAEEEVQPAPEETKDEAKDETKNEADAEAPEEKELSETDIQLNKLRQSMDALKSKLDQAQTQASQQPQPVVPRKEAPPQVEPAPAEPVAAFASTDSAAQQRLAQEIESLRSLLNNSAQQSAAAEPLPPPENETFAQRQLREAREAAIRRAQWATQQQQAELDAYKQRLAVQNQPETVVPGPVQEPVVQPPVTPPHTQTELAQEATEAPDYRQRIAAAEAERREAERLRVMAAAQQRAEAERRAQQESARRQEAEAEARREAERIRAEEEAAQRRAEEEAALREAARKEQEAEESARMARLMEMAAQQLTQQAKPQAQPLPQTQQPAPVSSAPAGHLGDDEEDDLEAELRRLIFRDYQ